MKTITETFDVFTYDELAKPAQDAVINQIIQDWIECPDCIPDFEEIVLQYDKACQKSEEMQTPWFLGEYIWEYCEKFVLSEAKQNYYLASGKWYCPIDE